MGGEGANLATAEAASRLVGAHPAIKDPLCTIGSIQGGLRGSDVGGSGGGGGGGAVSRPYGAIIHHQDAGSGSGIFPVIFLTPPSVIKPRGVR